MRHGADPRARRAPRHPGDRGLRAGVPGPRFGASRWPFTLARPEALDYRRSRFPGVYEALEQVLVLPWNERFEPEHVDFLAACIREAADELAREAA